MGGKQVQRTFKKQQSSGGSSCWGRVRSQSVSFIGKNESKFVQPGQRANKEGEAGDSGEEKCQRSVLEQARREDLTLQSSGWLALATSGSPFIHSDRRQTEHMGTDTCRCTNTVEGTKGSFYFLMKQKAEPSAKSEDEDGGVGGLKREEEKCQLFRRVGERWRELMM